MAEIDELLDFTNASIKNLTTEEIERIRFALVNRPERHNSRSVMVVNSQVEYGLGRMFGSYMEPDVPVDRYICYSIEDALEWLRPGQTDALKKEHQIALENLTDPSA